MFQNFDFWSFLAGLVGGVAITLVSVRIRKTMTASEVGTVVDQSKARAGRDIVGGNKN